MEYGPMSADVPNELDALREKCAALEAQWADAIAKYPDLAPVDPYLKRAREILADECGLEVYSVEAGDWDETSHTRAIIRALKEGMPAPVRKPCALTPEELAQWRLEQARLAVIATGRWKGVDDIREEVMGGKWDTLVSIQSALATLTEYNITPEMGK